MSMRRTAALALGFALDALLGDPPSWPHPVRAMGRQIELGEQFARTRILPAAQAAGDAWPLDPAQTERLCGAAIAVGVIGTATLAGAGMSAFARRVHPALGIAVESFLFYRLLAARSLRDESMRVHDALLEGDLPAARRAVSMIVGRDVDELDERGVARAAVETVAENTSDGVVAPLLYMGAFGIPGVLGYKAANTLDSMMGYRNERYLNLGRAAAKIDDAANLIPARITGMLMCAAAGIAGFDARSAWHVFRRDRRNHASPNAAHAEAACAGALGIQLGGPASYFGKPVRKPPIGDETRPIEAADIPRANRLMYATALLGLGAAVLFSRLAGPAPGRKPGWRR